VYAMTSANAPIFAEYTKRSVAATLTSEGVARSAAKRSGLVSSFSSAAAAFSTYKSNKCTHTHTHNPAQLQASTGSKRYTLRKYSK
jgi:hypothetical protein